MYFGDQRLDETVEKKKLALNNKPQEELMSNLAGKKGLISALAAQKLLTEKEAEENNFALAIQNNPKTIVEQNEEKLAQLSQNDVLRNVSGVLSNRLKKAAANNKLLSNMDPRRLKAMATQQQQQRPMGIPNAPVARQQNLRSGGIVGFQYGSGNEAISITGQRDSNPFRGGSEFSPSESSLPLAAILEDQFGEEPAMDPSGDYIVKAGSTVGNWIAKNPAEAAVLAITAHPVLKGGQAAWKVSKGTFNLIKNIVTKYPKTAGGITAGGLFVGQDAINPALKNLPNTFGSVVEGVKGIPSLAQKGYKGIREGIGFESPGLFDPAPKASTPPNVGEQFPPEAPGIGGQGVPFDEEAAEFFESEPPANMKEVNKTKNELNKIGKKFEPINSGDSSATVARKEKVYDDWHEKFNRLAYLFSTGGAGFGTGTFTRAEYEYDQAILANKRKAQLLRLEERKVAASERLNNLRAEQLTRESLVLSLRELDKNITKMREFFFKDSDAGRAYTTAVTALDTAKATDKGFFTREATHKAKIAKLEVDVAEKKAKLDIAIREAIPDLLADRDAYAAKLYDMYGIEYTSPYENLTSETKDDFNLKDKKTVEQ
tara:strand:+ start:6366 stop:8168 length:1803 start_codon:yes stop_codon:yes gene_type:complete